MDQETQQAQTIETPPENQTSEVTPTFEDVQANTDQSTNEETSATQTETPALAEVPAQTNTTSAVAETPTVPCDCKCIHKLGYVEVVLADGTKLQMTVQQAQDELTKFENIKEALGTITEGGTQNAA